MDKTEYVPGWRQGQRAWVLFFIAALVYLASGSVVPHSHDTTANAYVSVSLLGDGDLAFTPLEAPLMFLWNLKSAQGTTPVTVQSWAQQLPGSDVTFAASYQQGVLELVGPRYFLARTIRTRAETGEALFVGAFGPAAGLSALPLMGLAWLLGADLQGDAFAMFRAAKWTAGLLAAGSVALLFLAAAALTTRAQAWLVALAYAFGSCVWTVSSQALWQQTPELFFLSLGALCVGRVFRGRTGRLSRRRHQRLDPAAHRRFAQGAPPSDDCTTVELEYVGG